MPPKVRFQQSDIIDAAFELTRKHGIDAINARSVAGEIGCSTQPIFRVFENMEQLKDAVFERSVQLFRDCLEKRRSATESAYKSVGMVYLLFALQEPHLFHLMFLNRHRKDYDFTFTPQDSVVDTLIQKTGFNREQSMQIHQHMKLFVNGMATMLSIGQLSLTVEEIDEMLSMEYRAIVSYIMWDESRCITLPV